MSSKRYPSYPAGMTLIETQSPTGVATVTFANLGLFTHLKIVFSGRVTSTGSASHSIYAQFNGDNGSNYDVQTLYGVGTTTGAGQAIATATPEVFLAPEASITAGLAGSGEWLIPFYREATFHKATISLKTTKTSNSSGGTLAIQTAIHWRNTGAITSILLGVLTSGNFETGTKISLYGIL